jgi:hypothetical protein
MITELDHHPASPHEKKLVLLFMLMPRENAGELDQFHFLPVQRGHHFGTPVLMDERELFGEGTFIHDSARRIARPITGAHSFRADFGPGLTILSSGSVSNPT